MNDVSGSPEDWDSSFCHDLPTEPKPEIGKVLVTGASGYIGGRLVPELLARGYAVRVMVRGNPSLYEARWPGVEAVQANVLEEENLTPAFEGIHTAYYLIHSLLLGPKDFHKADVYAAFNFKRASHEAGVKRIIHLGGMDCKTTYSAHLQSRLDVAQELVDGAIPVTTLRAAVIIGSGSASYEIVHHLVERLPLIPIPRWAQNRCQPIAVRDVVKYLVGVLETPETSGTSYDIGSGDVLTYELMLKAFAHVLNRKILFVTSPISNIRFLSFVASQLTPVPPQIVSCLMEGLKDEAICRNDDIRQLIPFEPLSYKESVLRALACEKRDRVHTRWSDAYPPAHELAVKLHELQDKPAYTASYSIPSEKDSESLFKSICTIGGKTGWFHNNWMWRARGAVDRILFGVGSVRGRKRQSGLHENDVVDFWRVENVKVNHRLLLRAEMKLPGKAWLEFLIGDHAGQRLLSITAHFAADGFWGSMYWYLFLPFHNHIFNGLIEQIEKRA